jgi:DNA-3-methyladenine glycosylase
MARRQLYSVNTETKLPARTLPQLNKPVSPVLIRRLRRDELPQHTVALTRFLIGKVVVHNLPEGRISGRIVEAEAYPPGDPAGHHFRGPTPRIRAMYMSPGHAYVFFNYGNHFMLNVSSEPEGTAGGILIRALEPLEGIALMQKHRGTSRLRDLTRGPGRLAAALQITREHDGIDLTTSPTLWLGEMISSPGESGSARRAAGIGRTVRIGITRAADRLLRFYERGNPFVSGPKHLLARATADQKTWNAGQKKRRAPR